MSGIVEFWYAGSPKTKGSMESIGRGRMVQSVAGSTAWATKVRRAAENAMNAAHGTGDIGRGFTGPVSVYLTFWQDVDSVALAGEGSGDVDKLARNVLDALTKARVYYDDVCVARLVVEKYSAREAGCVPGVWCVVREGYA